MFSDHQGHAMGCPANPHRTGNALRSSVDGRANPFVESCRWSATTNTTQEVQQNAREQGSLHTVQGLIGQPALLDTERWVIAITSAPPCSVSGTHGIGEAQCEAASWLKVAPGGLQLPVHPMRCQQHPLHGGGTRQGNHHF